MNMRQSIILFLLFGFAISSTNAQLLLDADTDPSLFNSHWDASWVSVPDTDLNSYGVYFFRNPIELDKVPEKFIVHVSADNRYKLYVNEKLVGLGPARSDLDNWNYETYDLASYLKPGKNIIAAKVWNYGSEKPWAQISLFSAFIMQGNGKLESVLNTPGTWTSKLIDAYRPIRDFDKEEGSFIIVGPGDHIDGGKYPWAWMTAEYNDANWLKPQSLFPGSPKGVGTDITHALVPRTIPAMELTPMASAKIRKVDSQSKEMALNDYTIPPHSKTTILLDQGTLLTAYPELSVSGGKKASIKIGYSETLYNEDSKKENRDLINDMYFKGNYDIFKPDGNANRKFSTLWFRTFRYIQLEIETQDDELTIHSLDPIFTAYPFEEKAWFKSDNDLLSDIWNTGWHTSRLCANELFYDCPYYEQMQYIGDTRVQALIALYVSGDDRLMRKAIDDFYNSMTPEGLTQSRYPSDPRQIIPTYSLFWVSMVHDYLWHRPDYMFASEYLVSIQHILQWFENRIDSKTGMLGPIEYWPFVDWTSAWPWDNDKRIGGVPKGGQEGNSSIITLQYAMTLDQAADIFYFFGLESLARTYVSKADKLVKATKKHCWDEEKQFFADTPEKTEFSQHANILAVLTNAVPDAEKALLIDRTARSEELIETSYYFRFYLHRAIIESGLGNKFLEMLSPWAEMLEMGLSTFAEMHDLAETRSDCHAWSSSPLYEFLATVAGIRPADIGFKSVIIEPHPGSLKWIKAGLPHHLGVIEADLQFDKNGKVKGSIVLPEGLKGIFVWDKQTVDLKGGENKVAIGPINAKYLSE
jgi:alpha-L-rhamnosidase